MLEFPLPFRDGPVNFPNNRNTAYSRTKNTFNMMRRKHPEMFISSVDKFAKNLFTNPPRFIPVPANLKHPQPGQAYWLPIFSVWQKKKARLVFDSAAKTDDVCLNDKLLQGPDRNNALRAVLLRFRERPIAFSADVENMFHQFFVPQ